MNAPFLATLAEFGREMQRLDASLYLSDYRTSRDPDKQAEALAGLCTSAVQDACHPRIREWLEQAVIELTAIAEDQKERQGEGYW